MFSAFSFGKIIKTILPGLILTTGLVLLAETVLRSTGASASLLHKLADKDFAPAAAAVLVPLSLILGFFLNTVVWLGCNQKMRERSDAELSATVFPYIRAKLAARLWQNLSDELEDPSIIERRAKNPTRESLEYFYLPALSLDRLNYLWESYFSWYEFQINSAAALLFLVPGEVLFPWVAIYPSRPEIFLLCLLSFVPATVLLAWGLCYAAQKNLTEYRKNLVLLIAGALVFSGKAAGSQKKETSWWSWLTP